jgi:hypothetical protein
MIEKGDKVRFLNDIGGGVVARIIGDTAYVEDADGFEIPAKLSQIVLVQKQDGAQPQKKSAPSNVAAKTSDANLLPSRDGGEPKVSLALLQGEKPGSLSGDFRLYFVNDSPFDVLFVITNSSRTEGKFELMYKGTVAARQVELIDKVPGRLVDNKNWHVQLLLYSQSGVFEIQQPVSEELKIRSVRLLRDGAFVKNDYFSEKALLFPLVKSVVDEKLNLLQEKGIGDVKEVPAKPIKKTTNLRKGDTLEIDLHIHELLDDIKGLSNGEMFKIQMDKFHRTIDENKQIKGLRIVFIHGVGNGTLKNEIIRELKTTYRSLYYQDASFKEYGYGATMVIV